MGLLKSKKTFQKDSEVTRFKLVMLFTGITKYQYYFNYYFTVNTIVKKCKDRIDKDSCTTIMHTMATSNICVLLKARSAPYSNFLNLVVPRPNCPIQKGFLIFPMLPVGNDIVK